MATGSPLSLHPPTLLTLFPPSPSLTPPIQPPPPQQAYGGQQQGYYPNAQPQPVSHQDESLWGSIQSRVAFKSLASRITKSSQDDGTREAYQSKQ